MTRLAHISDLHFGRIDARLIEALTTDLAAHRPDVLVVTGDLTQRARRSELEAAHRFLDGLPYPRVVVPGNHDIAPWWRPLERLRRPMARYRRFFATTPAVEVGGLCVLGLDTVDRFSIQEGRVRRDELARVAAEAHRRRSQIVVVAGHHPIIETEVRAVRTRLPAAHHALETLAKARVDLVLSGHLHESFSGPELARIGLGRMLAVQASTTTSTRVRGHENAWNLIDVDGEGGVLRARVEVRLALRGDRAFRFGTVRHYERDPDGPWKPARSTSEARPPQPVDAGPAPSVMQPLRGASVL
jgi:3',5'-cyclic AMP phosphodiesterase CpdA